MDILVTGGTGRIGRSVVRRVRAAGHAATPASRGGEHGVTLDLNDPTLVECAAAGRDAALLVMPLGPQEGELGPRLVAALRRARVPRIVMIGIHNAEAMQAIPHFAAKLPTQAAVLAAGGTVLACNWFMQNDRNVLPAIVGGGVYPLPVGSHGVWAIDVEDIAAAAVTALTGHGWQGREVPLCGPECLTGAGFAASWSAVLGRPVTYAGDDVEPFIAGMRATVPGFGGWIEMDFRLMITVTQAMGCPATPEDRAATAAILGRSPTPHSDFAQRTVEKESA